MFPDFFPGIKLKVEFIFNISTSKAGPSGSVHIQNTVHIKIIFFMQTRFWIFIVSVLKKPGQKKSKYMCIMSFDMLI